MDIVLRPREPGDEELLRTLFTSARPELGSLPLPDEARRQLVDLQWRAQEQEYRRRFPEARDCVVVVAGEPAGRLLVAETDVELRVVDVVLADEVRGQGVGTGLVTSLCRAAAQQGIPVRLSALRGSRAVALYERLGFRPAGEAGPYVELEWPVERADLG